MFQNTATRAALAAVITCLLGIVGPTGAQDDPEVVLGPFEEVAVVEDFPADRQAHWKPSAGSNVVYAVEAGCELPGVAATLLRLHPRQQNRSDSEPSHNWFQIARDDLPAGAVPAGIDGFRFLLASHAEAQWWIQVNLTTRDGQTFSTLLADHSFPAGRIVEYTVPLAEFRSEQQESLTAERARGLRGIAFTLSTPGTALYIDRVSVYRQARLSAWLDLTTSRPQTNLFQRTDPVALTFRVGGTPPAAARGFRVEVRDFWAKVVQRHTVRLTDAREYTLDATPKTHGYYEVRAFWTDAAGKDLQPHSCLRAEGTVPAGTGTFSVVPGTVAENVARFKRLGARAFFGLHGDFLGLADDVGLAWRFDYLGWRWIEPERPDRSAGPATWARDLVKNAPEPDYRFHILPFRGNLRSEIPAWALRQGDEAPPFADWEDYLAMLRDYVRAEKQLYPHMKPRLYGGAWEVNLNMPPYASQPPEFTPAQVVELFRRTRAVVKAEDPDGWVLGPCPSVIDLEWFERLFQAGVLRYLDGIETHGYCERVFTPEENDFPGKLARLRALMRRYGGRVLPIYCTEAGHPGILGAQITHHSQAQRMVRTAIILKGEGVRVFLPFYGIDYDRAGYWGFCFNKEVDPPAGPWSTKRISPKPMVNAVAACVRLLEGAAPKARLRTLGDDVWAYTFTRDGTTITAVWTPGKARTVRLPVGKAPSVEVVNLIGHSRRVKASGGAIRLPIDGSPQYVCYR